MEGEAGRGRKRQEEEEEEEERREEEGEEGGGEIKRGWIQGSMRGE